MNYPIGKAILVRYVGVVQDGKESLPDMVNITITGPEDTVIVQNALFTYNEDANAHDYTFQSVVGTHIEGHYMVRVEAHSGIYTDVLEDTFKLH